MLVTKNKTQIWSNCHKDPPVLQTRRTVRVAIPVAGAESYLPPRNAGRGRFNSLSAAAPLLSPPPPHSPCAAAWSCCCCGAAAAILPPSPHRRSLALLRSKLRRGRSPRISSRFVPLSSSSFAVAVPSRAGSRAAQQTRVRLAFRSAWSIRASCSSGCADWWGPAVSGSRRGRVLGGFRVPRRSHGSWSGCARGSDSCYELD
jgi:hypothetical protein